MTARHRINSGTAPGSGRPAEHPGLALGQGVAQSPALEARARAITRIRGVFTGSSLVSDQSRVPAITIRVNCTKGQLSTVFRNVPLLQLLEVSLLFFSLLFFSS